MRLRIDEQKSMGVRDLIPRCQQLRSGDVKLTCTEELLTASGVLIDKLAESRGKGSTSSNDDLEKARVDRWDWVGLIRNSARVCRQEAWNGSDLIFSCAQFVNVQLLAGLDSPLQSYKMS